MDIPWSPLLFHPRPPTPSVYIRLYQKPLLLRQLRLVKVYVVFFTNVTARQGHAHTPSDTSITSGSTSVVRGPQALWRRQGDARENEVSPYILPSGTTGNTPPPSQVYPGDRKQRPHGLQYTPPPPATPALPDVPEATAPYAFLNAPPPAPIVVVSSGDNSSTVGGPGPGTVYGMLGSSIVDGEEIDRQETMSPANASSILEAAPPYSHDDRHIAPRHAPTLPNVVEYPEEKARFNSNASPEL